MIVKMSLLERLSQLLRMGFSGTYRVPSYKSGINSSHRIVTREVEITCVE